MKVELFTRRRLQQQHDTHAHRHLHSTYARYSRYTQYAAYAVCRHLTTVLTFLTIGILRPPLVATTTTLVWDSKSLLI